MTRKVYTEAEIDEALFASPHKLRMTHPGMREQLDAKYGVDAARRMVVNAAMQNVGHLPVAFTGVQHSSGAKEPEPEERSKGWAGVGVHVFRDVF